MDSTALDEKYMRRCLALAVQGQGTTSPNPMVGCVIVYRDLIIGEGYHHRYGEPHAEVNAIASVQDKSLLKESTLYVSLEPCAHFGKTPPCADLVVSCQIPRVVVGSFDPNPKVSGKGILKIRQSGAEVVTGVLKEECDAINRPFLCYHREHRPYIILKWAESADGFVDRLRPQGSPIPPVRITGMPENRLVHQWRAHTQSIMVGTETALKDNPQLTVRCFPEAFTREPMGMPTMYPHPLRIVLDRSLRLPHDLHVFDGSVSTWVLTALPSPPAVLPQVSYYTCAFENDAWLQTLTDLLYAQHIQSLLVEGGTRLLQTFIDAHLWDEARVFVGHSLLDAGVRAPVWKAQASRTIPFEQSTLHFYYAHE